jgi:uncharacterized membrane protein YhdT
MYAPPDDPLLKSARREAAWALFVWILALGVTLVTCYLAGYLHPREKPAFVLGFPAWVFWGVILPWAALILVGAWFAYRFMKDEDLGGEERPGDD